MTAKPHVQRSWIIALGVLILAAAPLRAQLELPPEEPIRIGRHPALAPDGSRFCFTYQGNLWVVPVEGGPATRLTANDSYDSSPRWSPDGKRIAYIAPGQPSGAQIFVKWMDTVDAGTQITRLERSPSNLQWSPDGKSIAFIYIRGAEDGTRTLWITEKMIADGSEKTIWTAPPTRPPRRRRCVRSCSPTP